MISNIPIYRAKKINNDEYVEGYLIGHYIFKEWIDDFWTSYGETMSNKAEVYNIDVSTLAIHFPDILDSQGNKVFASLSEDGKGGDICRIESEMENYVAEFTKEGLKFYEYLDNGKIVNSSYYKVFSIRDIKVIGIQE